MNQRAGFCFQLLLISTSGRAKLPGSPTVLHGYQLALYSLYQLTINENSQVESDTYQCVTLPSPSIMTLSSITHQWKKSGTEENGLYQFLGCLFVKWLNLPTSDGLTSRLDGLENRVWCSCQIRTANSDHDGWAAVFCCRLGGSIKARNMAFGQWRRNGVLEETKKHDVE